MNTAPGHGTIEDIVARAEAHYRSLRSASDALASGSGVARSRCGAVDATVDCSGRLADLTLRPALRKAGGSRAAQLITATVADANRRATTTRVRILRDLAAAFTSS